MCSKEPHSLVVIKEPYHFG
uniref:Uncharacterized protein n=1 Tax=Rhizophora mucronata TaxID=61149 RepID=A0A2P2NDN4_RHIMU